MENVIGNLLEGCHVSQARWLASLFNHSCLELDVVLVRCSTIYNQLREKGTTVKLLLAVTPYLAVSSESQNVFTVNLISVKRLPLLRGRGHPFASPGKLLVSTFN